MTIMILMIIIMIDNILLDNKNENLLYQSEHCL